MIEPGRPICIINGKPGHDVPADDRGLLYGDGLFETMALHAGTIRRLDHHLERLELGCERLHLATPDRAVIEDELRDLCKGHSRAVVKVILTRGSGPRGYAVPRPARVTRILQLADWPSIPDTRYTRGVRVRICDARLGRNPRLAGVKHLNRLEQVMARLEWHDDRIHEGLMLDDRGLVIGGTMTNVFAVTDGRLMTPLLTHCGISGVMRRAVIESAHSLGIAFAERRLRLADLESADELFLTNAIIGLWPVRQLAEQRFRLGSVTRELSTSCRAGGQ